MKKSPKSSLSGAQYSMMSLRQLLADYVVFPEGRERRDQAERMANTDALTGLANVRAFARAQKSASASDDVIFVMFDGDNFGQINKHCGHQVGDKTIVQMARAIQTVADRYPGMARVFRTGGDEFVVLLEPRISCLLVDASEPPNIDWRLMVASEFRDRAERLFGFIPIFTNSEDVTIISLSGGFGHTMEEADRRLAEKKEERKNGR